MKSVQSQALLDIIGLSGFIVLIDPNNKITFQCQLYANIKYRYIQLKNHH